MARKNGTRLWHIALNPEPATLPTIPKIAQQFTLTVFSSYDLHSVEDLVTYFHTASGFPVKDTWLKAIKNNHYTSWPGVTFEYARKYCPSAVETLKGHLVQTGQGIRSTKTKVSIAPSM